MSGSFVSQNSLLFPAARRRRLCQSLATQIHNKKKAIFIIVIPVPIRLTESCDVRSLIVPFFVPVVSSHMKPVLLSMMVSKFQSCIEPLSSGRVRSSVVYGAIDRRSLTGGVLIRSLYN
jgi:hypothetical protein